MLHFWLAPIRLPGSNTLPLRSFPPLLRADDQALLGIEPIDPLRVHFPALALQQHRQPTIPIANATAGQLPQSHPQRFLRIAMMLVTQRCPMHRNQLRDMPLTELMGLLRPLRQFARRPGPQSFFATISCRTCRSSERSATSRFSFPFSSRS